MRSVSRSTRLTTLASWGAMTLACGEPVPQEPPEAPAPPGVYGVAPPAAAGRPSVVTLDPVGPAGGGGVPAETQASGESDPPTIDQLGLAFIPTTLFARVGEPVVFTNSETIVHNVHLLLADNDSTVFDVDTDPGAAAEFVFDRPGGYDVTCDHHPGMRAFIFVSDAERRVFADTDGSFVIPDVPPGTYTLSVWSVNPELRSARRVDVIEPGTEIDLTAS